MKERLKAPELRFDGFTDDWEDRKLEDISEIIDGDRGKNYPSGDDFKNNGHTLFLSAANVTKQGFVFKETQYITKLKSESLGNGKVILNDIILTSRGSIGHIGFYDKKTHEYIPQARINSGMLILRTDKLNSPSFIAQFLKSPWGIKQIKLISFGSAQPQLTKKDIKNFKIILPKMEEQQKIGSFFKQLDDTIALHQRKLDLLKEQKKGYLQKMFPKNGAKVPELRFAGFADDWEERKLSDIVVRLTKSSNNNQLPKVEFEDIIAGEGRLNKDISRKFDDRKGTLFEPDNILYGKLRPYLKNWLFSDFKGIALGDFWVFKSKNSEPKFVYSLIQADNYQRVANDTSGTKMPRSDWKKVSSSNFSIPTSLEEQQKIGSFFKQLDNTIALHQRKLDLLKEQKKGFLQKMFV